MKILLIGNFTPPYEEENLYNLSLLEKLEADGHKCSIINASSNPSKDKRFVDTKSYFDFTFKLLRMCRGKDVIHFLTKGYLRLGLLKLMTSILVGKLFRAKSFITIHSELFSIQGQMRSPVGGRQTLFTAFTFADRIICSDKDTYNVAYMYMRKTNFELIPSFIHIPDQVRTQESPALKKLRSKRKIIIFSNVKYPSFLFEILKVMVSNYPLPSDVGLVISLSEKPSAKLQHVIEEAGKEFNRQLYLHRIRRSANDNVGIFKSRHYYQTFKLRRHNLFRRFQHIRQENIAFRRLHIFSKRSSICQRRRDC